MAKILGMIGTSHSPTIGFALDKKKQDDPAWRPIFEAYEPVQKWLAEKKPDVMVIVYNDHITSFFFDHYSHFALGVGTEWRVADEGGGARALPPIRGHAGLARHIASGLTSEEFDLSFFQEKPLDHGCFSPLSMMWPHEGGWPGAIIPLQVGVLQFPIPTARRCYRLGQALRRAIESYPEDISVVLVGTGGLSHQVHGERAGFNNTEWDLDFLHRVETDPESLTEITHAEYAAAAGLEGAEVIMWLVARGALSAGVRKIHQTYYLPTMTGLTTVIYENQAAPVPEKERQDYRDAMDSQLTGIEKLEGTYPFTIERSVRGYRLNRFLHEMITPAHRERFLADPESLFAEYGLTEEDKAMVRARDWRAMIHYGVIFFMLEKLGAVVGVSNLHIYAAMRGQSLEDFQKTRNAPDALYSVGGNESKEWGKR